jgi:hypothetical protein
MQESRIKSFDNLSADELLFGRQVGHRYGHLKLYGRALEDTKSVEDNLDLSQKLAEDARNAGNTSDIVTQLAKEVDVCKRWVDAQRGKANQTTTTVGVVVLILGSMSAPKTQKDRREKLKTVWKDLLAVCGDDFVKHFDEFDYSSSNK